MQNNGLRDLNGITFEFEDPFLMALLFEVLSIRFKARASEGRSDDAV